jgi:hypothetical protein
MNANHTEGEPRAYSYDFEAQEIVKHALSHENPNVSEELLNVPEFRKALGKEIATLLWREQDDEAEEVVEDLKVPEDVLHSDVVHSAALHELMILESEYPEKIPRIIRLVRIFKLPWEEVLEEVRDAIRKSGHPPKELEDYREAA